MSTMKIENGTNVQDAGQVEREVQAALENVAELIRTHVPPSRWSDWVKFFSERLVIVGSDEDMIFARIDDLRLWVDAAKKEPDFSQEVQRRASRSVPETIRDNEVLKEMAVVIAFSQQAKDKLVGPMIDRGDLDRAFCGFDVNTVAQLDPAQVERDYWRSLSVIRYKKKIKAIVECAQKLIETRRYYGSFVHIIGSIDIPASLNTLADVDLFWTKFSLLRSKMREAQFPYFQRTTSLLHLLLDFGFPCVKPDSVVLQVASDIGIEGDIISVVKQIQRYSVSRNTPPAVMDFYFLVYGGQTWAEQFLERPLFESTATSEER
jgi:hypothetical protein